MTLGFIQDIGPWQLLMAMVLAAIVIVPIRILAALLARKSSKSNSEARIICPKCGVANSARAKFCMECGESLG